MRSRVQPNVNEGEVATDWCWPLVFTLGPCWIDS